jgi:hypothetical protein
MNEEAKIRLSPVEMELVNNTEWIFTKHLIIEKVYQIFGKLNDDYKKIISRESKFLPEGLEKNYGKITKGENYKGLPYVILDCPASFNRENIFAVRTMFWWGNFFSISLHLSGESFYVSKNILRNLEFLKENNFFLCVNETQWEHHFEPDNFKNIKDLKEYDFQKLYEKSFFKIAKKIDLNEWNLSAVFLKESFEEIIEFLKLSFPAGEKAL